MKKFVFDIILVFFLTLLTGEIITRYFELRSQNTDFLIPDKEGFYSYKPNSSGDYVFGKPPNIHKTKFNFNDIGFNTVLNIKDFSSKKNNVAFLGDSFVESFQVDISDSFSSLLMKKSNNYQSYDFGFSGYGMKDYIWIYENYNLINFDHVILITGMDDFTDKSARHKYDFKKENFRKFYNSFYFFSYLNFNHNIIYNLLRIFKNNKSTLVSKNDLSLEYIEFFRNKNIIIVSKDQETYEFLKSKNISNAYKINKKFNPVDFGILNYHWNKKGRENVVTTILPLLDR